MMIPDKYKDPRRDKRGRFTGEGAAYYGRLGGEASRRARRKKIQQQNESPGYSNT